MRLTNKGRQALAAMIDVALHQKARPVAVAEIARRQKIPVSSLEQLFGDLRRHRLVTSTRGPGGGYKIARTARTITVADVIFAVDRSDYEPRNGRDRPGTDGGQRCLAPELWSMLSRHVVEFLDSVHLQQLVDDQIGSGIRVEVEAIGCVAPAKPRAVRSPGRVW